MEYGRTELLVQDFAKRGDPLGNAISLIEIPQLSDALRRRLDDSKGILDGTPRSVSKLEAMLAKYHQARIAAPLSETELVSLVREVGAYVGMVFVNHFAAVWTTETPTLWWTSVVIDGPWEVHDETTYISPYPTQYQIAGEAANYWDRLSEGKRPRPFSAIIRQTQRKSLPRERLT